MQPQSTLLILGQPTDSSLQRLPFYYPLQLWKQFEMHWLLLAVWPMGQTENLGPFDKVSKIIFKDMLSVSPGLIFQVYTGSIVFVRMERTLGHDMEGVSVG